MDKNWEQLKKNQITWALLTLIGLFTVAGALSLLFEAELNHLTQQIVERLGFAGLATLLVITDSITSPIPPDAILFVVAKSELSQSWPLYVGILAICSVIAGNIGWTLGWTLQRYQMVPKFVLKFATQQKDLVLKYGRWVVVLGALTPLPFSLTCWSAGMLRMPWKSFFGASLFRIPRVFAAYFLLHHSNSFNFILQ